MMSCPISLATDTAKAAMRRRARTLRAGLTAADNERAVARMTDLLLAACPVTAGLTVAGFYPIRDEPDIRPLLHRLAAEGCRLALPRVTAPQQPLTFHVWTPGDPLATDRAGVPAPDASAPRCGPAVILTPLLAFDRAGYRLGYGGGFYDRTLAALRADGQKPLAAGLAQAVMEVAEIPRSGHDQPLDLIITEREVIRS